MAKFDLDQVIWGKVTGHPWWPGIITEVKSSGFKVEFIGEFKHLTLPESCIKSFEDIPEKQKSSSKRLKIAISYAEKINKGEITVNSVEELNRGIEKIFKEARTKPEKKEGNRKSSASVRKDLTDQLKKILKTQVFKAEKFSQTEEVLEIISALDESQGLPQDTRCIVEVLSNFPSIPKRVCRYLFRLALDNEKKIGKIANVIEDYQILWKKNRNQEGLDREMTQVRDKKLRKHVCRRFAIEFQKLGMQKRESQIKALNLEESIRTLNQEMGENYRKKCKLVLKKLKDKLD